VLSGFAGAPNVAVGTTPAIYIANFFLHHIEKLVVRQLAPAAHLATADLSMAETASQALTYCSDLRAPF
jgi:hypothetical protein